MNNPSDTINDLRNAVTQYEREHGTLSIEPSIHTTANCEDCSGSCSDSCTEACRANCDSTCFDTCGGKAGD